MGYCESYEEQPPVFEIAPDGLVYNPTNGHQINSISHIVSSVVDTYPEQWDGAVPWGGGWAESIQACEQASGRPYGEQSTGVEVQNPISTPQNNQIQLTPTSSPSYNGTIPEWLHNECKGQFFYKPCVESRMRNSTTGSPSNPETPQTIGPQSNSLVPDTIQDFKTRDSGDLASVLALGPVALVILVVGIAANYIKFGKKPSVPNKK